MEGLVGGTVLVAVVAIVLGLLNCFFGYRFFRLMLGIYGFIVGFGVGSAVAGRLAEGNTVIILAVGAIAGLIGAMILVFLYFVGVFIVGALAGIVLANALGAAFNVDVPLLVSIIVAILVGLIALFLQRIVIILATAFSGSWAIVSGVVSLLTGRPITLTGAFNPPDVGAWQGMPLVALVAWLLLGIVGAAYQFRATAAAPAARVTR